MEASTQKRDLGPLTGALFVVLVLVAFIALGGNTPDGDASARKVVSFYSDNENKEIIAAVVLALSAVPLLYFTAILRNLLRDALPARSVIPAFALGGGAVAAAGFTTAATIHFALADYTKDIQPAAAQALNALDSDFFLPFTTGLAVLVLAISVASIRTRVFPRWLGWVGVVLFVVYFTPAGFIAFGLTGIWIIVTSILLYLRGTGAPATTAGSAA
jgi:Domain of unknown function (DUF4386)